MKVLFAILLAFTNWYYIPSESSVPVEVENIDLNLKTNELAITFLSLSSGEATLIQHENGENILINTGSSGTEIELKKLLELYNVQNISTVILTKDDPYFRGNLTWILQNYDVKQLIVGESTSNQLKSKKEIFDDVSVHVWSNGTKQQILPGLHTEVLFEGDQVHEGMDLSLKFLRHRLLILTSMSDRAKAQLMEKNLSDANIFKVPQFAIENSLSHEMIKHMDPQIAVIFSGEKIKPSSDIFELLHDEWIDLYYTKKHGTITIKFTDINYEVITISHGEELK